ncbi:MAG: Ger(x)C family spore germination protein [Firmicutes bacterium]|nr:Ger(x)C family spore germination protein [Bacillota bacterium]
MRLSAALVALCLALASAGCWDRKEPDDMVYAVALGFDIDDDGDYVAIAQFANPVAAKGGAGPGSQPAGSMPFWTNCAKGRTPFDALANLSPALSREMTVSNIEVLLISEKLAKRGIAPIMDLVARDNELRLTVSAAVVDGSLRCLLESEFAEDPIPALSIQRMLNPIHFIDPSAMSPGLLQSIADMLRPGQDLLLPVLRFNAGAGSESGMGSTSPRPSVMHIGSAAFHRDRMIGWLDGHESRGANFARSRSQHAPISVQSPAGGLVSIHVTHVASIVKPRYMNGDVSVLIKAKVEGHVQGQTGLEEGQAGVNFAGPESLRDLRSCLAQCVREDIEHALAKSREYRSDFIGLGNSVYRRLPRVWRAGVGDHWYELLRDVKVDIEVEATLTSSGLLRESLHY